MNSRGQGALEYLLLIGGAVLVAAIVIALITSVPATNGPQCSAECSALTAPASTLGNESVCNTHPMKDATSCPGLCTFTATTGCYYTPA